MTAELTAEAFVTDAYREYGEYTLEERAIPALQDGLLPVQRRILFAMFKMGLKAGTTPAKCAAIVGDAMGRYHPHGDASIYKALVNMSNPSMAHLGGDPGAPVDPQGNFGTPWPGEGDFKKSPPAAMRYTEARLSKIGTAMFDYLDVAEMVPNFDGTREEPHVVPSRLPMLLMQGCTGVALGANTVIPPHHPRGLIRAAQHLLQNPDAHLKDVAKFVRGPDYGHSSVISTRADILEMYRVGKGTLYFLCDHHIEKGKDCHELVITSLAPGFLTAGFLKLCETLEREGKILACNDTTDSSGPRLTIQFKDPAVIEERIIPRLRTNESYNWNVLDKSDGKVQFMKVGLLEYLSMWLEYLKQVEEKMLRLEGKRAFAELRREQGKLAGIQNIEALAKILANPKLDEATSNAAIKQHVKLKWGDKTKDLDDEQVQVLLDQKIRSLRSLNLAAQEGKVRNIMVTLRAIKHNLEHMDEYVHAQLDATAKLFPESFKRGTKLLNGEHPELVMPEADGATAGFWCVNNLGYVRSFPELPERKGKWHESSWTLPATPAFTVVATSGHAHTFQSVYMSQGRSGVQAVAGVSTDTCPYLLVVDAHGNVGVVGLPVKKGQVIMKTDAPIMFAAGVHPGDAVYATDGHKWASKAVSDIGVKRPNSHGMKLLKTDKPVRAYVIPEGGYLVANNEGAVDFETAAGVDGEALFAVGTVNWVVDSDNNKKVVAAREAASMAQRPGILHISILR